MKIALVENFGSDFYGARLRYALFLQKLGHEVIAIVPNDGYTEKIRNAGINTIAIDIDIRERSLSAMLKFGQKLGKIFKKEKFDVIHLYRMQPNIIGTSFAFFNSPKSKIINHITGLGVAFTKTSYKYKLVQKIVKFAYKFNSRVFNAQLIFQNIEDKLELGNDEKFLVIKGSAVDEDRFKPIDIINTQTKNELMEKYHFSGTFTLIFVSRLLKQKGLDDLVNAVNDINKEADKKINLMIVGWIDPSNPDSFSEEEITAYSKLPNVAYLGKRNDIDQLIAMADAAVLPTFYREGTPRFLLEAMAMAKPILTTDMPGCNHLVKNKQNGVLVEPRNKEAIVEGLRFLLKADAKQLGVNSEKIYKTEFSEHVVYNNLLSSYKKTKK
jgi:glycosyltransferase involved in cell wall biosynthesis